jgi:hypothetical protein
MEDAIAASIQHKGLKISLRMKCKGGNKMIIHGIYKIVRN